jgi:DNA primase large subunit
MRTIHTRLRVDHHLRYFARQQYGLFLKGAGMPLEGSVAFFRHEFTKKMDIDKVEFLI